MNREIDITGMQFGHLTVIRYDHSSKHKAYYECQCDCGKVTYVSRYNLSSGKTQSCGHLRASSVQIHRGGSHKVELTEKQISWLLKHYCHTKNSEIKEKLEITDGWLHRFARAHGLTKTVQFMKKCQANSTSKAKESHLKNGTYPPKGYIIPGSKEHRFQLGVTPEMRLGKHRNKQRIEKVRASLAHTRKVEKARYNWGLEQKTRLKVSAIPVKYVGRRWYMVNKLGYSRSADGMTLYYGDDTKRSAYLENATGPFRFKPMEGRV